MEVLKAIRESVPVKIVGKIFDPVGRLIDSYSQAVNEVCGPSNESIARINIQRQDILIKALSQSKDGNVGTAVRDLQVSGEI